MPRILLRIFPEFFEDFSCFVSWETETRKNSPKIPAIFQCKIPRQIRKKNIHKMFLESRQSKKKGIPHRRKRYNVCPQWCRDTRTVTSARDIQGKKKHININKFAGLSRDWGVPKRLFMCFFQVIPYGGGKHINKIPPKIPGQSRENFVYVFCSLCVFFSYPRHHTFPVNFKVWPKSAQQSRDSTVVARRAQNVSPYRLSSR